MDIHRCRFIPYPPAAINALAFSHPSTPLSRSKTPATLRLAIGRANGDIEIWNPLKGAWFQESILRGGKDRSIEGLVWTNDPEDVDQHGLKSAGRLRLFSIGYSTAVTEWDLATGRPARHSTGNYGEIWCIAAQPRPISGTYDGNGKQTASVDVATGQYQDIAVGCADGSIVLLSTADGDLQFKRTLARPSKKKARVLSITFKDRYTLVAGHADSTIRVYDIRGNQLLRSMSLGAGPVGGPKEILVWSISCTIDGTIVSGDSTGTVRFWDGKQYTLLQRIVGHGADILDLAVSADGQCVFSGGMDRRTTVYRRTDPSQKGSPYRWKEVAHQRLHKHDVKVMASYENKNMSIVASGGLDTIPIVTPLKEFGREHHRSLSNLPQQPCLCSSPRKRLVVGWWDREINIWRLSRAHDPHNGFDSVDRSAESRRRRLVSKIELQGEDSLSSVDLSDDGSLLTAATMTSVRIFGLRSKSGNVLRVQRVDIPSALASQGARLVRFSPDRRWLLVVRADSTIYVHRITQKEDDAKTLTIMDMSLCLNRLSRPVAKSDFRHGILGAYDRTICRVAFSSDSRILAVGDLSGYIDTWVLEGHEDLTQEAASITNGAVQSESSDENESEAGEEQHPTIIFGQHWIGNPAAALIPRLRAAVLILTFRPYKIPSQAHVNGNIAVHPTRHNPHPHSHELPSGEDRLVAVTSEHHVYELEVLAGRFSDWSRRNPTISFPQQFRETRERAMGAIWDISATKQRIWLHGSTWLWMFDLSRDMPPPAKQEQSTEDIIINGASQGQKRKRSEDEDTVSQEARTYDTGAGSRILGSELNSGIGRKMRKIQGVRSEQHEIVDLVPERQSASEDDDDDAAGPGALVGWRRAIEEKPEANAEDGLTNGDKLMDDTNVVAPAEGQQAPPYWSTYMYRPILGIVPLRGGGSEAQGMDDASQDDGDEDGHRIEVALVERPMAEVDLPAKFYGEQEWNEET